MVRANVEQRREEIMDVTCRVVLERGFAHTRVADVAAALGVSTGTIHYHFASKDALLAESLRAAAASELRRLAASVARGSSATDRLDRVFRAYLPGADGAGWIMWIDAWAQALRSPEMREISEELDARWEAELEAIIREGVASGEFTCADPHGAAWRLTALLDGLALQVAVHKGTMTNRQMLDWARHSATLELGLAAGAFPRAAVSPRRNHAASSRRTA